MGVNVVVLGLVLVVEVLWCREKLLLRVCLNLERKNRITERQIMVWYFACQEKEEYVQLTRNRLGQTPTAVDCICELRGIRPVFYECQLSQRCQKYRAN